VAGTTRSPDGDGDAWVIKTDAAGRQVWAHTFGGDRWDYGLFVQQITDGGYVVAGQTRSSADPSGDAWVIKLDVSGEEVWSRTFGGQEPDEAAGGFIVAGHTTSPSTYEAVGWLLKVDAAGDEVWSRTLSGTLASSAQQTRDGGYIAAGYVKSPVTGTDAWLSKVNASGDEAWSRTFGGPADDSFESVQETRDGGYIVAGETASFGAGGRDIWLIKTDALGQVPAQP